MSEVLDFESRIIQDITNHKARSFSKNEILDIDDLKAEAYFVYLRCKNEFDADRQRSFAAFYNNCLANAYKDLIRYESYRWTQLLTAEQLKETEFEDNLLESSLVYKSNPEYDLIYKELVSTALKSLTGTARKQLAVMLSHPKKLREAKRNGNLNDEILSRVLRINKEEVKQNRQKIERVALQLAIA